MPLVGTTFCDWVIMVVWSPDSKVWVFELIVMGGSSLTDSRSVSEASSSGYSDSSPTHWLCDPGTDLQQNEDNKVYFRDSSEDSIILWELNEIRHIGHLSSVQIMENKISQHDWHFGSHDSSLGETFPCIVVCLEMSLAFLHQKAPSLPVIRSKQYLPKWLSVFREQKKFAPGWGSTK